MFEKIVIKKNITITFKSITYRTTVNILQYSLSVFICILFKKTQFVYSLVCSLIFLMTLFYKHFSIIKNILITLST